MVDLKEIVKELSEDYKNRRDKIKDVELLEEDLYTLSGLEKDDAHAFLYITIGSPYLQYVGSACGNFGNKVFLNENIVDFLKNKGVESILGILRDPECEEETYEYSSIPLASIVLPINEEDGLKFEDMVGQAGGSFRCDTSHVKGWTVYESE